MHKAIKATTSTLGKIILLAFLVLAYSFYHRTGVAKIEPVKEWAENRGEVFAKTEFNKDMRKLEKAHSRHEINDADFAREYANEQAILVNRTELAKNPISKVCHTEMDLVDINTRLYPLPKVCADEYQFPVWPGGPKKVLKVEWVTPGGQTLVGSPELLAGRGSSATPLGNNLWEVEGDVSYVHKHAEDDIQLRTVIQ